MHKYLYLLIGLLFSKFIFSMNLPEDIMDKVDIVPIIAGYNCLDQQQENNACAIPKVEIFVIGEAHKHSHRRIHNRIIQDLITEDTVILIEDDASKTFNVNELIPAQLQYIDKNILKKATIIGWDSPIRIQTMETFYEMILSNIKNCQKREHEDFIETAVTAKRLHTEFIDMVDENIQMLSSIKDIFRFAIDNYINTAKKMRELHDLSMETSLHEYYDIVNKIISTPEGWDLRTETLKLMKDKVISANFKRIIFVGGKAHFQLGMKHPFDDYVTRFYDSFIHQEIIGIFTRDYCKDSEVTSMDLDLVNSLCDRFSENRKKHLAFYSMLSGPIESWRL